MKMETPKFEIGNVYIAKNREVRQYTMNEHVFKLHKLKLLEIGGHLDDKPFFYIAKLIGTDKVITIDYLQLQHNYELDIPETLKSVREKNKEKID